MKSQFCLVLAVLAVPAAAHAQQISGGLTLSYGITSPEGTSTDLKATGLDGRMTIDFDNGATFGVQVGKINIDIEGAPFDLTGEFIRP